MSDEVDRAQIETDRNLERAVRSRRPEGPVPNGRCHFCDEIVHDGARWCDADCRDAWQDLPGRNR